MPHDILGTSVPDVLTPAEVSLLLRIGRSATYRLLHSGHVPVFRNGRAILVPKRSLEEFVASSIGMWYNTAVNQTGNPSCSGKEQSR